MDNIPPPKRPATGPGCLMLIAIIIGTVIGLRNHQPSAGLVIGMGVAALIAAAAWIWDRFR